MSKLNDLMHRLTQAQKAEAYNTFLMKYNTEDAAEEVLDSLDHGRECDVILERVVIAFTLDAMRRAAERAGSVRSPRKTRPARENGRKGGRPRKNGATARQKQKEGV